jgi:hypothetical protein
MLPQKKRSNLVGTARTYTASVLSHCSERLQLPSGQLHPFCVGLHLLLAADALLAMPPRPMQPQCPHCSKRVKLLRGSCCNTAPVSSSARIYSRLALSRPPAGRSRECSRSPPPSLSRSPLCPVASPRPAQWTRRGPHWQPHGSGGPGPGGTAHGPFNRALSWSESERAKLNGGCSPAGDCGPLRRGTAKSASSGTLLSSGNFPQTHDGSACALDTAFSKFVNKSTTAYFLQTAL